MFQRIRSREVEKVEPYFDQGLGACEVWSVWGVLGSKGVNIKLLCLYKTKINIDEKNATISSDMVSQLISDAEKLYGIKIRIRYFGRHYTTKCIQKTIQSINHHEPFIVGLGAPYGKPCIIRAYDLEQERFLISEIGRDIPITLKEFQSSIESSPEKSYIQIFYPKKITRPEFSDVYSLMVDFLESYAALLPEIEKIPDVITNWFSAKIEIEQFREGYYILLTHLSVQRKTNAAFFKELDLIYGETIGALLVDSLAWLSEKWTVLRNIIVKTKCREMMDVIRKNEQKIYDLIGELVQRERFVYENLAQYLEGKK